MQALQQHIKQLQTVSIKITRKQHQRWMDFSLEVNHGSSVEHHPSELVPLFTTNRNHWFFRQWKTAQLRFLASMYVVKVHALLFARDGGVQSLLLGCWKRCRWCRQKIERFGTVLARVVIDQLTKWDEMRRCSICK